MTSRYTDTSRFEEADWDLLAHAAPSILSDALSRDGGHAVLFVESSRHSNFNVRQTLERGRMRVPQITHRTRYLEGASVEIGADDSSRIAVASEPSAEALRKALVNGGRLSSRGRLRAQEAGRRLGFDAMNQSWPDAIDPNLAAEFLRTGTESCFSLSSAVCHAQAELRENVRRVMVVTSDGFAGFKRGRTISCKLMCESVEGFSGVSIRGGADPGVGSADLHYTDMGGEAVSRMSVVSESTSPAAGSVPVILTGGWCAGVWLHEAIGHHFESDNVRRGWSSFGVIGERISDLDLTLADDATIAEGRGTHTFDDEGIIASTTVLVDRGVVRAFINSRRSAAADGCAPSGNGRRENYLSPAQPRMTNIMLRGGDATLESMISSVSNGLLVTAIGRGVVDARTGMFSFEVDVARALHAGTVGRPVSGFIIAGESRKALSSIRAIGNDFELDTGRGSCVKNGQRVPVGLGAPSLLIESLRIIPHGESA